MSADEPSDPTRADRPDDSDPPRPGDEPAAAEERAGTEERVDAAEAARPETVTSERAIAEPARPERARAERAFEASAAEHETRDAAPDGAAAASDGAPTAVDGARDAAADARDDADADDSAPDAAASPADAATAPRLRRRRRRGRRRAGAPSEGGGATATDAAPASSAPAPGATDAPAPPAGRRPPRRGPRPARERPAGRPRPESPPPPRGTGIGRGASPYPQGGGPGERGRDGGGPRGERKRGRDRRDRPGPPRAPAPPPAVVPAVSRLVDAAVTPDPFTPDEVVEMRQHLAFLREYKEALRIRLNAAEDLLVNGRRDPTDRGVCHHLLGKVDRAVIEAAVAREPMKSNAAARARMLAGAIRLTADVGVLLAYLETLAVTRSHAVAAQAFAEVVARIDFESLSTTRLVRLLQVLTETFEGQERVQVLFSLLDGAAFRRAFDTAATQLPPEVAAVFAPLRAVHARLQGETPPDGAGSARLALGLDQVLAAPDPVLRGYPEPLRVRMVELALDPGIPTALADRAAGVLLTSLAQSGKTFTRLAMRRAAQLLARHVDDRARATLEEVRRAAPGHRAAERWLAALDARRVGRIALTSPPPERGRLAAAFWLDGQRPVWVRTAPASDGERLAAEAALQGALALPGVATVVEHGSASGIPYIAIAGAGLPWRPDEGPPLDVATAVALAAEAARIVRALALAGVALPDVAPERFCLTGDRTPGLVLVDLERARTAGHEETAARALAGVRALVTRLLPGERALAEAGGDLVALIQALDRFALVQAGDRPRRR